MSSLRLKLVSAVYLLFFSSALTLSWLIFLSPYRWAPVCNSSRKLNQHPESTVFGQSASWHAFPAPTAGPRQRVQRDLREPASPLSTGFTVSFKKICFFETKAFKSVSQNVRSLRLSYILLLLPWQNVNPFLCGWPFCICFCSVFM